MTDRLNSRRAGFAAAGRDWRAFVLTLMARDDPLYAEFQEIVLREGKPVRSQNKPGACSA